MIYANWGLLIILCLVAGLVQMAARAEAAAAPPPPAVGTCTTTATPCLSWTVTLPPRIADNPSIVLHRVWDGERPDEGRLTINGGPTAGGCEIPLFGGLAAPANDARELPRLSYEVLAECWRTGPNTLSIRWTTNQAPAYHEIRGGVAVEYALLPVYPPAGCRLTSRQPDAGDYRTRLLRGCSDGQGGLTTTVKVLTAQEVEALFAVARRLRGNDRLPLIQFTGPLPLDPESFTPSADACDRAVLWEDHEACQ